MMVDIEFYTVTTSQHQLHVPLDKYIMDREFSLQATCMINSSRSTYIVKEQVMYMKFYCYSNILNDNQPSKGIKAVRF